MSNAYKEVGTLNEIGAQVGDVVAIGCDMAEVIDVREGHGPYTHLLRLHGENSGQIWFEGDSSVKEWRIISRAQTGPVRTVTTTRREIVDGQYGHLRVTRCPAYPMGVVSIDLMYNGWWSEKELTGLIDTLTAIRDAMQANTTA